MAATPDAYVPRPAVGGLLPVCRWCGKTRDDQGYWKQLALYVQERTDAKVTHGLCPECTDKLHAEMDAQDAHKEG
jgi:hypothetical protein